MSTCSRRASNWCNFLMHHRLQFASAIYALVYLIFQGSTIQNNLLGNLNVHYQTKQEIRIFDVDFDRPSMQGII